MTPELNRNEGLPDGAEPDATRRINAGQWNKPRQPNRKKREPPSGPFERHTCVPGMGAKGSSLKSRVEPRRALTEAKVYWFLRSLS